MTQPEWSPCTVTESSQFTLHIHIFQADEIKQNAQKYVVQIADVLAKVNRQMLLIFKVSIDYKEVAQRAEKTLSKYAAHLLDQRPLAGDGAHARHAERHGRVRPDVQVLHQVKHHYDM